MPRGHLRRLHPGASIRTLIVDDSATVRQMISRAFERDPLIQVVGTAANGSIALKKADQLNPDAVVLDIEMPGPDGLQTLIRLRELYPQLVIIMFSSVTERAAEVTLQALALGADDYLPKSFDSSGPAAVLPKLRAELGCRIRQFFESPLPLAPHVAARAPAQAPGKPAAASGNQYPAQLLAIGASTGGPAALATLIQSLPPTLPLPIVVVQHMPPMFTRLMAERMNDQFEFTVREAVEGAHIQPGEVWIAPGDYHMRLTGSAGQARIALDQAPPENSCRPSVDVLFRSVADTYGGRVLAVVLTGMGRDGQQGCISLKAVGARVIVQDEATSVVWGMPGSVVQAGVADWVLPLGRIGEQIEQQVAADKA